MKTQTIARIEKAISLLLADEQGNDFAAREFALEVLRELSTLRGSN